MEIVKILESIIKMDKTSINEKKQLIWKAIEDVSMKETKRLAERDGIEWNEKCPMILDLYSETFDSNYESVSHLIPSYCYSR